MEKPTHSLIYKGSIPEAINEARRQKKLFIVYISGEDENSILLEQSTWVDQNVHETILKFCVFLHLIEGSLDASQFSAIYPNNAIPSISVINGLNGVMLWNHEGYISAESLKENIEKSLATMHLQDTAATLLATAALATQNPPQPGPLSSNAPSTSQNEMGQMYYDPFAEREVGPTENDESSVKDDVTTAASSAKPEPEKNTEKEDNIDISRVEKSTDSSPDDADVITAASSSNENKNKTEQEEEVTVPVPTVEKSTDSSPNNADVITAASSAKPQPGKIAKNKNKMKREEKEIVPAARVEKSKDVLVNVKMPEGTSHQIKLTKSDALRSVRSFVDRNLAVGFGPYRLAVPYPRKLFTEQDMDKTLSELGFSNREALIVISEKSLGAKLSFDTNVTNRDISNGSNNEGYFGKLRRIISYVNPFSYFGGNYEALDENTNREESPFSQERSQQDGQTSVNSRYRTSTGTGTGSRPFGSNIHTLRHDNEGEASNNRNMFWNGNSTQFGGDNNNNDSNNNK